MASRRIEDLHPYLASAYKLAQDKFLQIYPTLPQPFLTSTYRSPEEQNALYAQGRTKPGNKVTNARAGQSLHNYLPSFAFDIAFVNGVGKVDYSEHLFKKFADIICNDVNVEWGGSWKSFKDTPHFGFVNFKWSDAKAGRQPAITALSMRTGKVTADTLNIRDKAAKTGTLIGQLNKGASVFIYQEKDGWYRIDGDLQRWVSMQFVTVQ